MPTNLQGILTMARMTLQDLRVRAFPEPFLVNAANEGKNELMKIIRQVRQDYFETTATGTISATTAPNGSTITLPTDFAELKEIMITTLGFEDIGFIALDQSDPRFRQALIDGGVFSNGQGFFYYDIQGLNSMVLAPGADIALPYSLSYIQTVPDMVLPTDAPTGIPVEHYDFIGTWIVCEGLRNVSDQRLGSYTDKLKFQKDTVTMSVGQRQIREPRFVRGFMEAEEGWG